MKISRLHKVRISALRWTEFHPMTLPERILGWVGRLRARVWLAIVDRIWRSGNQSKKSELENGNIKQPVPLQKRKSEISDRIITKAWAFFCAFHRKKLNCGISWNFLIRQWHVFPFKYFFDSFKKCLLLSIKLWPVARRTKRFTRLNGGTGNQSGILYQIDYLYPHILC